MFAIIIYHDSTMIFLKSKVTIVQICLIVVIKY